MHATVLAQGRGASVFTEAELCALLYQLGYTETNTMPEGTRCCADPDGYNATLLEVLRAD